MLIRDKNFFLNKELYHKFINIYALELYIDNENQVWQKKRVWSSIKYKTIFSKRF